MWNKLSMTERAKYINLGVQNGITDINIIRDSYNSYAEGGYTKWKEAIIQQRPLMSEDMNAENPTYDYESYYLDNMEDAWKMVLGDPNAHFPDTYKTSLHPTFSNQSKYSGHINKYNPEGIVGGEWPDNYNYILSEDQVNRNWDTDNTLFYLKNSDPNVTLRMPDYSEILPSVTVVGRKNIMEVK